MTHPPYSLLGDPATTVPTTYTELERKAAEPQWTAEHQAKFEEAFASFRAFALAFARVVQHLLKERRLHFPESENQPPGVLPVMAQVYPKLAMHAPRNGRWHLGMRPDATLCEFRWKDGAWEIGGLATALCSPAHLYEALRRVLAEEQERAKVALANSIKVQQECTAEHKRLQDLLDQWGTPPAEE